MTLGKFLRDHDSSGFTWKEMDVSQCGAGSLFLGALLLHSMMTSLFFSKIKQFVCLS